jgi:AcrR family transcriptional regulator
MRGSALPLDLSPGRVLFAGAVPLLSDRPVTHFGRFGKGESATLSRIADPKSKSALLKAAEEVFSERGVAGAKIEDITRQAGVSKGAFYLHFESKEAAVKHIVEGWFERCASLFGAPNEYPDPPADPDVLLDFCIERDVQLYEFVWQTRPTMKIIHSCQGEYEYLSDAFREDMRRRNREWLELWRQDGLIRPEINIELAAILMSGAHDELSGTMIKAAHKPPIEEWLEFAQETFVRAFGTPELTRALDRRNRRATTGVRGPRLLLEGTNGETAPVVPAPSPADLEPTSTARVRVRDKG